MRCDSLNMHGDNATFYTTIQATIQHALWELGAEMAGVARAREPDRPGRTKIKMAEETHSTPPNFYRFAYSVVEETQWLTSIHKKAA